MSNANVAAKDESVDEIVKITNGRLSFPKLFKPKSFREGQDPRFEATFLLDPSDAEHAPQIANVKAAAKRALVRKYGSVEQIPKGFKDKMFYADDGGDKDYDGYAGMFVVRTSSKERVPVVDQRKRPLAAEDGKPYAGCYVNAAFRIWVQDHKEYGKRVNATLKAVQFAKDGEAFGVKPLDTDEVFDDLSGGEDDAGTIDTGGDDEDFLK
jgi:hypothetical protein